VDDKLNSFQWGGRLKSFLANFKFADDYDTEEPKVQTFNHTVYYFTR